VDQALGYSVVALPLSASATCNAWNVPTYYTLREQEIDESRPGALLRYSRDHFQGRIRGPNPTTAPDFEAMV
jgi:hypothetical protein